MANPFIQFIFRRRLLFAVLLFSAIPVSFSWTVNRWFVQHESSILASLNETFGAPVTIRRIHYSLFKGILIDDFVLKGGADRALPLPVQVKRIQIRPSLWIYPHPGIQLGHAILEEPNLTLRADLSDLIQMGRFLNSSPKKDKRFGPFYLKMRLSSLQIQKGTLTLLSSSDKKNWRQDFEGVELFLSRRWFGGERLEIKGHLAKHPDASFHIRGTVNPVAPEDIRMDLLFDCRQFASATLTPYLGFAAAFPDQALTGSFYLKVKQGGRFYSKGQMTSQQVLEGKNFLQRLIRFVSPYLIYEVEGEVTKGRCRLSRLSFKTGGVEIKGEGDFRLLGKASVYTISMSTGKISLRKLGELFPGLKFESGKVRLFLTVVGTAEKIFPSLDIVLKDCSFHDRLRHLNFSKMGGRVRVSKGRLVIDNLLAFLNDYPVRLRGQMVQWEKPRLVLEAVTYPEQIPALRNQNPLSATLRIIGAYDGQTWNGDLWLAQPTWSAAFHGVRLQEAAFQHLQEIFSRGTKWQCKFFLLRKTNRKTFDHLVIHNAAFFLFGEKTRLRCDLLEGVACKGKVFLQNWVDLKRFPYGNWTSTGSLSNVDVVPLLRIFGKSYPLTGRLSAEGSWSGQGNASQLLGRFALSEGNFGPTVPLQRLADETGIEPLRQIKFRTFSGQVAFRDDELNCDNWKIESDQALLSADLKIRDGRVGGILSAKFPESSLRNSSELKWLLHYVGGKGWIDFDFKVAGSPGVPRLQWLSGEFKRKVETKLPPGLRDQLGQEIEKRILGQKGGGKTP